MKKIYFIGALALAGMSLAGCNDFLNDNRFPLSDQTVNPEFWNNGMNVENQINTFYNDFLGYGNVTGSGRTVLWKDGFEAWKSYPIAGVGFWYLRTTGHWYFSFHCTPLTYLYCAGVLGLLAYLYHRFMTVRAVFGAKLTKERVFVALTMLAMLCNALLDIAMTSATHLMYYSVMLALIDLDLNFVKTSAVRRDGPVVATDDMDRTEEKTDNNSASDNTINQDGEQNEL